MGGKGAKLSLQTELRKLLTALGLYEIYTYSFIAKGETEKLGLNNEQLVTILNPLGEEYSIMRTQLVSSMLGVLSTNINHGATDGAFFEISKRFIPKALPLSEQPDEKTTLSIGMFGENEDFFTLKGAVETVLTALDVKDAEFEAEALPVYLHPGRAATVKYNDEVIAVLGEVHPKTAEKFDISKKCYVAEIYIDKFEKAEKTLKIYKPLPKFPAVSRDLALICDASLPVGKINAAIKRGGGKLLETVKLFDVYQGSQIEEGKKSVAYNFTLRSENETLTDDQIERTVNKILKELKQIGAELRM